MNRITGITVSLVVFALSPVAAYEPTTHEVCASGCPYTSIQVAINASVDTDTVLVHDGTYTEILDTDGKAITVRSVNGSAFTTIDANGLGRVLAIWQSEDERTIIEGFTITGGDAAPNYGGGIAISSTTPVIRDCIITGNTADKGGGIYILYSVPTITGCTISSNTGTDTLAAGGVFLYGPGADAAITDCTISNNTGDGLYADWQASPVVTGCTISANTGRGIGGFESNMVVNDCTISDHMNQRGVVLSGGGTPVIANSRILNNRNLEDGGGIWINTSAVIRDSVISGNLAHYGSGIDIHGASPLIQRCLITGNGSSSAYDGAGISIYNASARIESCTISGNWALGGAGIEIEDHPNDPTAPAIVNCTIASNYVQASNHGGAGIHVYEMEATPVVKNTILWGNYARGGAGNTHEIELEGTSTIDVSYSDVAGGWTGPGNLNVDPEFVDPLPADQSPTDAGDYHLLATSDCIDAGTSSDAATTDVDGGSRPWGPGFDMGSDEYGAIGSVLFADGFESGDTSAWSAAALSSKAVFYSAW